MKRYFLICLLLFTGYVNALHPVKRKISRLSFKVNPGIGEVKHTGGGYYMTWYIKKGGLKIFKQEDLFK